MDKSTSEPAYKKRARPPKAAQHGGLHAGAWLVSTVSERCNHTQERGCQVVDEVRHEAQDVHRDRVHIEARRVRRRSAPGASVYRSAGAPAPSGPTRAPASPAFGTLARGRADMSRGGSLDVPGRPPRAPRKGASRRRAEELADAGAEPARMQLRSFGRAAAACCCWARLLGECPARMQLRSFGRAAAACCCWARLLGEAWVPVR